MGFMGTGKTSVGRRLAERLGRRFLDMDSLIEQRAGKSVSRIFGEDGEPRFRALEREVVIELASQSGLVIGAGGGVVLNPDNVADYARTGLVVCLAASPEAILRRVGADTTRPLLAGPDKAAKIAALLEKRRPFYDAIPHRVDTTTLSVDAAAEAILALYARHAWRTLKRPRPAQPDRSGG
jgi:shikimate kinase